MAAKNITLSTSGITTKVPLSGITTTVNDSLLVVNYNGVYSDISDYDFAVMLFHNVTEYLAITEEIITALSKYTTDTLYNIDNILFEYISDKVDSTNTTESVSLAVSKYINNMMRVDYFDTDYVDYGYHFTESLEIGSFESIPDPDRVVSNDIVTIAPSKIVSELVLGQDSVLIDIDNNISDTINNTCILTKDINTELLQEVAIASILTADVDSILQENATISTSLISSDFSKYTIDDVVSQESVYYTASSVLQDSITTSTPIVVGYTKLVNDITILGAYSATNYVVPGYYTIEAAQDTAGNSISVPDFIKSSDSGTIVKNQSETFYF